MPSRRTLWTEARRETGRAKDRFRIRDLFADERCSQAILDFLSTFGTSVEEEQKPEGGSGASEERRSARMG